MNIRGLGTNRLRLKLGIMNDEDLWWLFLHYSTCHPVGVVVRVRNCLRDNAEPPIRVTRRKYNLGTTWLGS